MYYKPEPEVSEWPFIDMADICPGYVSVPIKIDDNGTEHSCVMVAGHMGFEKLDDNVSIQPRVSWFIATINESTKTTTTK